MRKVDEEGGPRGLGLVVGQPERQFFSRLQVLLPQADQGQWCSPVPGRVPDARHRARLSPLPTLRAAGPRAALSPRGHSREELCGQAPGS